MTNFDFIGNTPIIRLSDNNAEATIWAKLENLSFTGSHKDRVAISFINESEKNKLIKPGVTTIVEASDGNLGISLSAFCKLKGYKLIIVLPENVNQEKIDNIRAYETEIVYSSAEKGLIGALEKAKQITENTDNAYMFNQFDNKLGSYVHFHSTADEIINQIEGKLDYFICGYGSGGIISGVSERLKNSYPNIKILGVEPNILEDKNSDDLKINNISGIGNGYNTSKFNKEIFDDIYYVSKIDAKKSAMYLAKNYGILVGISSGALYSVCLKVAEKLGKEKQILTIFFDTGERYLSSGLYR